MRPVVVIVLLSPPSADAGPLGRALAEVRATLAEVHRRGFRAAGADDVRIIADAVPFATAVGSAAARLPADAGIVVLGAGSIPLATAADRRRLVAAAGAEAGVALANNRYSGDVVAIPSAARALDGLPDLPGDNALPRWLAERAGLRVHDLRGTWRLQADLDGIADLALLAAAPSCPAALRRAAADPALPLDALRAAIGGVRAVAADRHAELLVAGRVSAMGLGHLEAATACRVRALVEERGLRASSPLAVGEATAGRAAARPPASILGVVLDRDGPEGLVAIVERLADAAVVDSRVLLAHRLGTDERGWPPLEDRLASDLLLADRVADPWLRSLTAAAAGSARPILLGGHSLVGPGLRLLFPRGRRTS